MYYYRSRAECPSWRTLSKLDIEEAAIWVAKAPTHSTEVNRLAQFQTWWGLSNREANERHWAAVTSLVVEA